MIDGWEVVAVAVILAVLLAVVSWRTLDWLAHP